MIEETIAKFRKIFSSLKPLGEKLLVDLGDESAILERVRHKPRVLVVGEFNVGKSSLINSVLGEVLLPVGVTPTTSILTTLERGPYQVKIKPIGSKETINIEPGKPQLAGYGIPDKYFDWEGFKALLTDPKNIEKIEIVHITNPAVPANIVIIDTPGINDLSKARSELLYGLIPSADIVLFVISALKPFSESERIFLEERLLANDLKKIVFVVNRMDEIDPSERQELLNEISENIIKALNTSYERINKNLGQTLFVPITSINLFPVSAKELAPISGTAAGKSIGFEVHQETGKTFSAQNRKLWQYVLDLATKDRNAEIEQVLHHFLRRSSLRIRRAIENIASNDAANRAQMLQRLKDNGVRLEKLKGLMKTAERKIQVAETRLKEQLHTEIEKALNDLLSAFRLKRDPQTVNNRLKELYEYITIKMKNTLEELYADLGKDFETVLDDKKFVEERKFEIQFDFSDAPQKIMSSLSFAYIAAIFFGISVGMFAGMAYFASQVIANKRSLKEFFQHATVSDEKLNEVKADLMAKIDCEIEYAVDFVRQSLVQKIDLIQRDLCHIVFSLNNTETYNIEALRKELDTVQTEINGFILQNNSQSRSQMFTA